MIYFTHSRIMWLCLVVLSPALVASMDKLRNLPETCKEIQSGNGGSPAKKFQALAKEIVAALGKVTSAKPQPKPCQHFRVSNLWEGHSARDQQGIYWSKDYRKANGRYTKQDDHNVWTHDENDELKEQLAALVAEINELMENFTKAQDEGADEKLATVKRHLDSAHEKRAEMESVIEKEFRITYDNMEGKWYLMGPSPLREGLSPLRELQQNPESGVFPWFEATGEPGEPPASGSRGKYKPVWFCVESPRGRGSKIQTPIFSHCE